MIPEAITRNPALHQRMANSLRFLAADAVAAASSGHQGMPMGMADVATVLFSRHLKFSAAHSDWPDRDRFVLSAGHGSMLLYGLLYLTGYDDMPLKAIRSFRQLGSPCAGHPEFGEARGIETTTGPLGQGLANAVGMAIAERMLAAHYADLVDHHTYFVAGDGCLMEGISHEAIGLAGHLRLGRLIGFFDDNGITIDGPVSLASSEDQIGRFQAAGWHVQQIDGHDATAIDAAIVAARSDPRPSLIAAKTVIGVGSPIAGTAPAHGASILADKLAATREALDWSLPPFEVPDDAMTAWRAAGQRCADQATDWYQNLESNPRKADFLRRIEGGLPTGLDAVFADIFSQMATEKPSLATRAASQKTLDALAPHLPDLVGGSADLTGSNNTRASNQQPVNQDDYSGQYLYYGIREHGMAGVMNGMALHGGLIPYGGTFLAFSDYSRPAIRLAALMGQRVIHVLSHDSIGLGEDGPTHQPVEHLASLRAIPGLKVFRPADALETAQCWQQALAYQGTSALVLSRQKLPFLDRGESGITDWGGQGAYLLKNPPSENICLIATGSEVSRAVEAEQGLQDIGVTARILVIPCLDDFLRLETAVQSRLLGTAPRIVVEAGIRQGWESLLRDGDQFIGMDSFGASAPAEILFTHFGITSDAIIAAADTARLFPV